MKKIHLLFTCFILLFSNATVWAQVKRTITGVITNTEGAPVPGATITIKGTQVTVVADNSGAYSISVEGNPELEVSSVNYATQTVKVGDSKELPIVLTAVTGDMEGVVVTALGIKRQAKSLGYATITVTAKQLTEAGNTNFASALYGKAAGVKITTAPGGAGSAVNVQIRGINSLNYNQQPLYVVDGIVIRNDAQFGAKGANNNDYWGDQRIRGNGILDINPLLSDKPPISPY